MNSSCMPIHTDVEKIQKPQQDLMPWKQLSVVATKAADESNYTEASAAGVNASQAQL